MQDDVIAAIAAERADQLAMLAKVSSQDWDRPTPCSEWSVKEVLAHIVEGELATGRLYRGEVRELGFADPEEGIARWRALPGEAIRAAYWQHGSATQRALDSMDAEMWRSAIRAFGCHTIGQLVRLHLFDICVHGHDLAEGLGMPPVWGPRLPLVSEFVVRAAPVTLRRLGIPADGALRVNAGDKRWTVDGRGEAWAITDEDAPATIRLADDALVLAVTGRRPIDEALDSVDGDAETARRILAGWQVVAPTPPSLSR